MRDSCLVSISLHLIAKRRIIAPQSHFLNRTVEFESPQVSERLPGTSISNFLRVSLCSTVMQQKDVENVSEENLNIGHKFLMGLALVLVNLCYIDVILYFPPRARQAEVQKYIRKDSSPGLQMSFHSVV